MQDPADTCQSRFERAWGHLTRPHVRALAWLLDASDLLDPDFAHWRGKIAALGAPPAALAPWLSELERDPAALDAALGARPYTRLGLYAEKLMAFYLREHRRLVAHGVQVRASPNDTIGEFDFLLEAGPGALEHWELATKFYLLAGAEQDADADARFDAFVGPNLADSLGAKMHKILDCQLALGAHPAAQALLPRPVTRAMALVKGWLFYPFGLGEAMAGISPAHCRGFWCALGEIGQIEAAYFVVLPRLLWLAPYQSASLDAALSHAELGRALAARFALADNPVLVACVRRKGGLLVEVDRGFVVPDNWRERAARSWPVCRGN